MRESFFFKFFKRNFSFFNCSPHRNLFDRTTTVFVIWYYKKKTIIAYLVDWKNRHVCRWFAMYVVHIAFCVNWFSCCYAPLPFAELCLLFTATNNSIASRLCSFDSFKFIFRFFLFTVSFFFFHSLSFQKYEVEFLLQQQWYDPRLRYANQSQYEYLNAIHHHEEIWLPDTYFIMHGDFKDPIIPMHFALRIYRNGTINYLMRFDIYSFF